MIITLGDKLAWSIPPKLRLRRPSIRRFAPSLNGGDSSIAPLNPEELSPSPAKVSMASDAPRHSVSSSMSSCSNDDSV
jgi:hypothetical protein